MLLKFYHSKVEKMKAIPLILLLVISSFGISFTGNSAPSDDPSSALPIAAKSDQYSTSDLVSLKMQPLTNDKHPESCKAKLNVVGQPEFGWVVNNNDGSFTYIPEEGKWGDTTFKYELCCGEQCAAASIELSVHAEMGCQFENWDAPEVISPNGDGQDDFFQFDVMKECWRNAVFSFSIYNENGEIIYQNTDYRTDQPWLAVQNVGKVALVPAGTYMYVLEQTIGRQNQTKTGYIEVEREKKEQSKD